MAYIANNDYLKKDKEDAVLSSGAAKPYVPASTLAPTPVGTQAAAPAASTAKPRPLNRSYDIMKGLMAGKQSNAVTAGTDARTATAGGAMTTDMTKKGEEYVAANTLADEDVAGEFAAWAKDANSELGKKFSAKMGAQKDVTPVKEFSQSGGYIDSAVIAPRGGTQGMRNLDELLVANEQRANSANLVGQQNAAIDSLMKKQGTLTDETTAAYSTKLGAQQGIGASAMDTEEAAINQAALDAGTTNTAKIQQSANERTAALEAQGSGYQKTLGDIDSKIALVQAELAKAIALQKNIPLGVKLPITSQLQTQLDDLNAKKTAAQQDYKNFAGFSESEKSRYGAAIESAPKSIMNSDQAALINRMRMLLGRDGKMEASTPEASLESQQYAGGSDLTAAQQAAAADYARMPNQPAPSTSVSSQVGGAVEPIAKDLAKTVLSGGLNKVTQEGVDTAVSGGLNKVSKSTPAKKIKKWLGF